MISEWIRRGYKDTLYPRFTAIRAGLLANGAPSHLPPWVGDEQFHASHRSNLLRKDRQWYGQFEWKESDDLPYVWPKGL